MTKIFTLSAAFVAAMSLTFANASAENVYGFAGSGTEADPYQLTSAADFATLAEKITAENTGAGEYFQLANDIDFTGVTYTPIAYTGAITAAKATVKFAGSLDGNAKSITNLVYDNPSALCAGLIGTLDAAGIVKNLIVESSCKFSGNQYIAAVVGMALGTVDNCINKADITASGTTAAGIVGNVQAGAFITYDSNYGTIQAATYAAGVSGMAIGAATFDHLFNYGSVRVVGSVNSNTNKASSAAQAGGVLGTAYGTVVCCSNFGEVTNLGFDASLYPDAINELTADKDGKNTGGIAAWAQKETTISYCTNDGKVQGMTAVGGILGIANADGVVLENCVNDGEVIGTVNNVGGIIGTSQKTTTKVVSCANNGVVTAEGIDNAGNIVGNSAIVIENCTRAPGLAVLPLDNEQVTRIQAIEANGDAAVAYDLFGRLAKSNGLKVANGKVFLVR